MEEASFAVPQPPTAKSEVKKEAITQSEVKKEAITQSDVKEEAATQDTLPDNLENKDDEQKIEDSYEKVPVLTLNYKEPQWSGAPAFPYTLEVLKNGQIVEEADVSGSNYVTVGRLPSCDVPCLHPSISRYHALLQHRPPADEAGAMFLYDLGGSYGTTVNKVKIKPHTYYMLKTGHVIKFGASTRLYIVKGPPEEAFEDEVDMVVEEKAEGKEEEEAKKKKLGILASEEAEIMLEMLKSRNKEVEPDVQEGGGVNWGFREDAAAEDDGELRLDLNKMSNPAEFKDPKKTLRGYFEREGMELEFEVTEKGVGKSHQYICKVELPIDSPAPVFAEGITSGKKRDAMLACALHGCKLLDAYGLLRSFHKFEDIETRREKLAKNDFYDSDEDTFLDRTGDVQQKRKKRMKRAGVDEKVTSRTHDMLTAELKQMNEEIEKIERTVAENKTSKDVSGDEDALDAFMVSVSQALVTSGTLRDLKKKLFDLKAERVKLANLCDMAKPVSLPQVKKLSELPKNISTGRVGLVSAPTVFSRPAAPNMSKKIKIDIFSSLNSSPSNPRVTPSTPTFAAPSFEITSQDRTEQLASETESSELTLSQSTINSEQDLTSDSQSVEPSIAVTRTPTEVEPSIAATRTPTEVEPSIAVTRTATQVTKPGFVPVNTPVSSSADKHPAYKPPNTQKSSAGLSGRKTKRAGTLSEAVKWDDEEDAGLVNWTPPTGQTGDGRTKLNEKFGY